jgi:Putative auto-transporter adhesin, head GIN domain
MKSALFLLPLAALSLSACGYSVFDAAEDIQGSDNGLADGKPVTAQAATTASFSKVNTVGPDNVVFVTGDAFSIKAEGDAETIKKLRYSVKDGTMVIGRTKGNWLNDDGEGVTVTITAPVLTEAALAGSGNFTADKMTGDEVTVAIAGSGDANVAAVSGKKLGGKIAGSGDVVFSGTVDEADFDVLGSGSIDAQKLTATNAELSIAGSGDVSLNATGKVEAKVAGSGSITVSGGAKCESKSMGSGSIDCS